MGKGRGRREGETYAAIRHHINVRGLTRFDVKNTSGVLFHNVQPCTDNPINPPPHTFPPHFPSTPALPSLSIRNARKG